MDEKMPGHVPLAVTTRGDSLESVHYGSIAVADGKGRLIHAIGDAGFPVFTRSTLKPFQALPFVLAGGPGHFGFSSEQVALLCASHSGEPRHVSAVADMLAKCGCSEDQLQCGSHMPTFYAATGRPEPADLQPRPLHHNCSGKHAGFLAWCRLRNEPVESYLDPGHPLQREIRLRLTEVSGCPEDEMPMGTDGCSAPNYALPLASLAGAYARLASPDDSVLGMALGTLFGAMTRHPEMVSGEARTDLLLMAAAPGNWVAKGGAEGVQALGIAGRGLGIAVKVADGSSRAIRAIVASLVEQLGLASGGEGDIPGCWREEEIRNQAGRVTGRLMTVFRLG